MSRGGRGKACDTTTMVTVTPDLDLWGSGCVEICHDVIGEGCLVASQSQSASHFHIEYIHKHKVFGHLNRLPAFLDSADTMR